jgi:hypothetical protein
MKTAADLPAGCHLTAIPRNLANCFPLRISGQWPPIVPRGGICFEHVLRVYTTIITSISQVKVKLVLLLSG